MYLYLVRHGQSEGNVLRTFHGQIDYPLTDLGRQQAQEAAEKLKNVSFQRCYASDLRRAWDTAKICLADRDIVPEKCPELREQFVGDMEGLTWEEMAEKFPGLRERYIGDWFSTTPPVGESPADMLNRVGRCMDDIIARGQDALLAGHNGSLSMALLHLGAAGRDQLMKEEFFFRQGCYSVVEIGPTGAKLLGFNL